MCDCCQENRNLDPVKNLKDLEKIKARGSKRFSRRYQKTVAENGGRMEIENPAGEYDIALCMGTSCISSGAGEVKQALLEELTKRGIEEKIRFVKTGCNGFCAVGPIMVIYPGGYLYNQVEAEDIPEIVEEHLISNQPVTRLMLKNPETSEPIPFMKDLPFFAHQELRVLRNKGLIAAESLEEYIARDGYFGFAHALLEMTPEAIIDEVLQSGLRGRGGAGFPTGRKWDFCRRAEGDKKYILCNADEGDPGAFMDRSLLESDPHAVLEGMMIGARAIGADEGYIYCRAEYPLALERLEIAIEACRHCGLLGKNIMGTDFSFDIKIARGSGAFVCGEETALMRSIEGKRGEPRPRPPFPAVKGLWEKPTVLNNVETLGNIPLILRNGAVWYQSSGTDGSAGTKIFAITGKVNNIGLIEIPIGTSLGDLVYDIGGGIQGGKQFKAAQIGGPSGGCVPRQHLNVPLDYESLKELGAIMGSGGLVVMDEDTCMVDVARFFLEFVQEESCGKCVPCRVGSKRMLEILERICAGRGEEGDIERLIDLGHQIQDTALCGLGQTAPNPVLSTIQHFRHEYEEHIREKKCSAGVCPELVRAPCQSGCPAGVDIPGFVALVAEKRYAEALRLHRERNPFAAICARVCFHTCEDKCRRTTLDEAVAIRAVKRFMVEQEITVQLPEMRENDDNAAKKIAIIGAGPAGLSCAYFLARLGYKPIVYEAQERPGGMLTQTIPAYRLPREIIAREIRMIERLGVEIRTSQRLGRDFTIEDLKKEGLDALFIGTGAPECLDLTIKGEDAQGIYNSIPFLRQYNIRGNVPVGRNVVVIGGGNAAIDAARTALRLQAETVTVIYRRNREQMPAYAEEIDEALSEGVKLIDLVQPTEFLKNEKGQVTGIRCTRMSLGDFDRSGRRRAQASEEESFVLETDQVIKAIGQKIELAPLFKQSGLGLDKKEFIKINHVTGQTSVPWIFSGGDTATGPASVVKAINSGEKAAVGIDHFLTGETHAFWRRDKVVETAFDPDAEPAPFQRERVPLIPVERRRANFDEVELPWTESVALRQCRRCLRCDYGKTTVNEKENVDAVAENK